MKTLIVTAAADCGNDKFLPHLFSLTEDGLMICVKSITGMDLDKFNRIYFSILEKHNKKYFLQQMFELQFERLGIADKAKVVVLKESTRNQPETIFQTICHENITGSIFCKDGDSFFECEIPEENSIAVFALDELDVVNPQHKSYVAIDEMYYITNIIEKRIIGNMFSAGGYYFENTEDFCSYYQRLKYFDNLYLSHLVFSMLLDRNNFRPIKVKAYNDWDISNCR